MTSSTSWFPTYVNRLSFFSTAKQNGAVPLEADRELDWMDLQSQNLWKHLPTELKRMVFEYFTAEDLCYSSLVSKEFKEMAEDPWLWQLLFQRDKCRWKCIQNRTSATITTAKAPKEGLQKHTESFRAMLGNFQGKKEVAVKVEGEEQQQTWKSLYIQQYLGNKKDSVYGTSAPFKNRFFKEVHSIPMLGEGLEGASAKKLLYKMMWSNDPLFKMDGLYPGVEGIGSGVGFTVNGAKLSLAGFYKYEDRGIFDKVRPMWKSFFKKASGFLFVLDTMDSVESIREELAVVFHESMGFSEECPVVIMAFEPDEGVPEGKSAIELAEKIGLYQDEWKSRNWFLCSVNISSSLEGVADGLKWLVTKI